MKIAFLFPGQGSQAVRMGKDIYDEYSDVREIFEMAEEISKIKISTLCFKGNMEELTMTVNLQPAVSAVNLGFLAVLKKNGVMPDISAGHSLGEYSALCSAGAVSYEDSIRLVFKRGELMHRESTKYEGAMHAIVGLNINEIQEIVDEVKKNGGVVAVANHNTENQIVVTGIPHAVENVSSLARSKGARTVALRVSGAWHSELIRGAEQDFRDFISLIPFNMPETCIIHNVDAEISKKNPDEIRAIIVQQLCSPVRWYDSMCRLMDAQVEVFAEIGPGKVLTGLLKKILPKDYPAKIYNIKDLKSLESFMKEAA